MKRTIFVISALLIILLAGGFAFNSFGLKQDSSTKVEQQEVTTATVATVAKADNDKAESTTEPVAQETKKPIGLMPGYYAPDFTLPNLEGRMESLSDYQGKYLLLNFWAIWCPPCKAEMPDLDRFHQENSDQMVVLGVELGSKPSDVQKFIAQGQFKYPILLDTKNKIGGQYRVSAIPTTYIINPEGKILHVMRGALNEKTLQLIKETFVESE